ncbi:MAG TPA: sigma-70 family RNA polymerase sigma factor [Acidobacteriaceae bacterium]|nr:sigma-70 family RNA polymerase sigma factor [Acidobacteriaceae bacterium]
MGTIAAELPRAQEAWEAVRPDALEEMTTLISERNPYFRRIALRRLDNLADAEDAVQDAFLSAWKNLGKFKGEAKMSTWLTVIVMNSARMVARKHPRPPHISIESEDHNQENLRFSEILADVRPDPEDQVSRRELELRLSQLSAHLAPNLREVIRLRGVEGLSTREAAEALGLTESAVKTRAARAREQLRNLDRSTPARVTGRRNQRRRRVRARLAMG